VRGCEPRNEQRAFDAFNRGFDYGRKDEFDKAIARHAESLNDPAATEWAPVGQFIPQ
jgi:hypothetical protein